MGFVTANFDGAIFEDLRAIGIGVAVRNEHGKVVAALAEQVPIPDSVFTLETLAARRAVLFARDLGLHHVFEGDLESSIHAISNRLLLHSSCGHIIHDILLFSRSFQSFSFSHVCRQGNALADASAKRASCLVLYWFGWSLFLRICITVICRIFCLLINIAFLAGFSKKRSKVG